MATGGYIKYFDWGNKDPSPSFYSYYRNHYMPFKRNTVHYIDASEIFKDKPLAWDAFASGDWDFTWGDNSFSLITVMALKEAIEECIICGNTSNTILQLRSVKDGLDGIDMYSFVNLEG